MIIRLYKKSKIDSDIFISGEHYIYKFWIFEFRLNPLKVIKMTKNTGEMSPEEFMEKWCKK